ncbi:MAG: hypothetical protein ACODAD_14795 [Planctomycetota bacterium]
MPKHLLSATDCPDVTWLERTADLLAGVCERVVIAAEGRLPKGVRGSSRCSKWNARHCACSPARRGSYPPSFPTITPKPGGISTRPVPATNPNPWSSSPGASPSGPIVGPPARLGHHARRRVKKYHSLFPSSR